MSGDALNATRVTQCPTPDVRRKGRSRGGPARTAPGPYSPAGASRSEMLLMQYRWSVGVG
ncbi:hypothetical protein GCM10010510_28880 [Streptomyces anandii JCM 4720]|nr:hypothetical protein GCM10010510_28880 [Streptomyces anandii JCM 4720]